MVRQILSLPIRNVASKLVYMQNTVSAALATSQHNKRELARRAGVSASTVTRIQQGSIDPTLGTARKILAAAGLQLPAFPEPLCDPTLIRAARSILSEQPFLAEDSEKVEELMRWSSRDGAPNPRGLAREAGRSAPAPLRPGSITVRTDWSTLRVFSTIAATRSGWAASGSSAAAAIGAEETSGPTLIYAENQRAATRVVEDHSAGSHQFILLPFDGFSENGAWHRGGITWADPLQIIMDCYGMEETVSQAEQLTSTWQQEHRND